MAGCARPSATPLRGNPETAVRETPRSGRSDGRQSARRPLRARRPGALARPRRRRPEGRRFREAAGLPDGRRPADRAALRVPRSRPPQPVRAPGPVADRPAGRPSRIAQPPTRRRWPTSRAAPTRSPWSSPARPRRPGLRPDRRDGRGSRRGAEGRDAAADRPAARRRRARPRRPPGWCAPWPSARGEDLSASTSISASIPSASWPPPAASGPSGARSLRASPRPSADLEAAGFTGRAFLADGRPYHEAGAGEAAELGAVLATAVTYLRALEAAGHDLASRPRPHRGAARRRCRRVRDDREVPRDAPALGADRAGLRARSEAPAPPRRDRVADDDPARSLREHPADRHGGGRRRNRRRRQRHRSCPTRRRWASPTPSPGGWRATARSS